VLRLIKTAAKAAECWMAEPTKVDMMFRGGWLLIGNSCALHFTSWSFLKTPLPRITRYVHDLFLSNMLK
jgi:hypothetical protein